MKRTGMMEIAFTNGIIVADAKTGMIDLKSIERMGMKMDGITEVHQYGRKAFSKWVDTEDVKEFADEVVRQLGIPESTKTSLEILTEKSGRGVNSKAFGHLLLALKYATYLNKELEVEVYQTFINDKILGFRLLGIDHFKELNSKVRGMSRTEPDYRLLATEVNKKCNGGEFIKGFDVYTADVEVQKYRTKIISTCITLIDMNMLNTFNDVLGFIKNFK